MCNVGFSHNLVVLFCCDRLYHLLKKIHPTKPIATEQISSHQSYSSVILAFNNID